MVSAQGVMLMRFTAEILLNGDKPIIPSNYRRNILSLINEAIKTGSSDAEAYEKYCIKDAGKIKPFTFSVSFETEETQNRKGIIRLAQPWIKLHVDADDRVILKRIYNGLLQLQKDYPLFPELKANIGPFYCQECSLLRCTGCKVKVSIGLVNLEP